MARIRKRKWTTRQGEVKEAWIVDYTDQQGERHIQTFDKKRDADDYAAKVHQDVKSGLHVAASKSIAVAEAGELWIKACEADELERATIDAYRQHLLLHIGPHQLA